MKHVLLLFILLKGFSASAQQSHAKNLTEEDKIIGEWQCTDETGPELYPGEPHKIIALKTGKQESIIGSFVDPELGLAGPSYFIALSDGKTIYGTLTQTVFLGEEGKSISFDYRYDPFNDRLIILIDKKEFIFERYKS